MYIRFAAILCIALCVAAPAFSQGLANQVSASQVDAVFSSFRSTNAPGVAVLVLRDGKPVFRQGYGVTDLRTMHRIDEHTNFRIASFTKQFTATAIMLLAHDGRLRYDERLTEVFPEFPEYGKSITIRHLLTHTSGLADYEELWMKLHPDMAPEKVPQIHDAEVLHLLEQQSSGKFPAGTKWEYSNSGFSVLSMVVEKTSGKSFGQFLHERIFVPLKMNHTLAYEKGKNEVPHRAYGHTKGDKGWQETDQDATSATLGDGGIYTSLDDLARWDRALREHTLLTEAEMLPSLTPGQLVDGPPKYPDGSILHYGFGWFLDPYEGHKRMSHDGGTIGFRTTIQRFPDDKLTIIVLANRADADPPQLALKVADLYLEKK